MRRYTGSGLVVAAFATFGVHVAAEGPRERPDDAYLPPSQQFAPLTAAGDFGVNGVEPVQVNVDRFGFNIPGDAGNEPSIAVDPTAPNRMVIGWRQFDNVASNFRQAGWGWSDDGGRTWTFPGVLEPGVFRSDPVLDFDSSGNFYYNSLRVVANQFTCQVFKSLDGGLTWLRPVDAFGGDKQWMAIDRNGSVSDGHVYCAWSTAAGCCGTSVFTRSVNDAASFQSPVAFPDPPRFGTMEVASNGVLYIGGVQSLPFNASRFLCVRSFSAQDPFSSVVFDLTTEVEMGGSVAFGGTGTPNPAGLLGQVNLATDLSEEPTGGNIYLLSSVTTGLPGTDVHFSRSEDGGVTFSPPVRVNDDSPANGAWQWFGTMSVAPGGRIDVVWNDTRDDPSATFSELYYSSSSDGGTSWTAGIPLTIPFNHFLGFPDQDKLGDYYEMVSDDVGAHLAFAATFNGEQDVFYLRIGDYDCNGNGIGDSTDLDAGTGGDCNSNGIPDSCEIAAGTADDADRDGVPDDCPCAEDVDGSGAVDVDDLVAVILAFGEAGGNADVNGSGTVDVDDLIAVILAWGDC